MTERLIDSHNDVGPRLRDDVGRFLNHFAGFCLLRIGYAVFEVELNRIGPAGMRLVDKLRHIDGDVEKGSPDRQVDALCRIANGHGKSPK